MAQAVRLCATRLLKCYTSLAWIFEMIIVFLPHRILDDGSSICQPSLGKVLGFYCYLSMCAGDRAEPKYNFKGNGQILNLSIVANHLASEDEGAGQVAEADLFGCLEQ